MVGDVWVWLLAARVEDDVPLDPGLHKVPLPVGHVVGQVGGVGSVEQIDLVPVVRPAGELHGAGLFVEGEVLHIDLTGRLEDGGAKPFHVPVRVDDGVGAGEAGAVLAVGVIVEDNVRLPDDVSRQSDYWDSLTTDTLN